MNSNYYRKCYHLMTTLQLNLNDADFQKEWARRRYLNFIQYTKPDFQTAWFHKVKAEMLEQFVHQKIKRLILCEPPRYGKTEMVSRRLPPFIFGHYPKRSVIAASYGADLASMNNRDVQRIIEDEKYYQLFPDTQLNGKNVVTTQNWLRNSDIFEIVRHGGQYKCAGVGGALTGMGGDYLLLDDPIKNREEADSFTHREKVWNWYRTVFHTRQQNSDSCILVTVTRWHEDDIVGRLLDLAKIDGEADQWVVVEFPAINHSGPSQFDSRQIDEPLWEQKHDHAKLRNIRSSLGERDFSALYQQRPSIEGGNIIKKEWFKLYHQHELPKRLDSVTISADCTFKGGPKNDYVVIGVWAKAGSQKFLIDMVRKRMTFTETKSAIKELAQKYAGYTEILIEEKANGAAIIDTLQKEISRIIAINPTESKESRLNAVAPEFEAGNVFFPAWLPWTDTVIKELLDFPQAVNDDIVDMITQYLNRIRGNSSDFLRRMTMM